MDKINIYQYGIYKTGTGNGVNELLYRLTNLLKDDFHIHFVNFDLEDATIQQDIQLGNYLNLHVFGKVKYMGFYFPKKFINWLDTLPPKSVFHLHSVFRLANFALAKILHQKNIPFIFTPHDSYSPESIRKKWFLKTILLHTTEKYILNKATLVHAITEIGEQHLKKYTKCPVVMVHNFVDTPSYLEKIEPANSICFLGRFDWYQKGIDIQIKAYKRFLDGTVKKIPFIMMGASKKQELLQIQKMIERNRLKQGTQVLVLGYLQENEKWHKLNESYVYFQLSRYEGFSYSVVEALSLGKPVVISRFIPIADYVQQYKAGFVVNNSEEAANALACVFNLSEEDYKQMSQNAKQCYQENFHERVVYPHLVNLYSAIFSDEIQGNLPSLNAD